MLRPVRREDLPAVHAIYMDPRVVPFLGVDPMPIEAFAPVFDALLAAGGFVALEHDDRLVGFCRVSRYAGRAAHVAMLGTLALSPAVHGAGLARSFIEALLERLRAEGVARVELQVEADNPRAIAFYRRLGFQHEGTQRAAYRRAGQEHYADELMMARLLVPVPRQPRDAVLAQQDDIAVRHAAPSQAGDWARLRQALWPEAEAAELAAEAGAHFLRGLPGLEAVLLALDAAGRVLGFAELGIRPYAEGCAGPRVPYLEGWFVAQEARGRGIGALLVRGAESWARGLGLDELASDARADDEVSQAAHRSVGFEEVEAIRCYRKRVEARPGTREPLLQH